jgi:plastocyanin
VNRRRYRSSGVLALLAAFAPLRLHALNNCIDSDFVDRRGLAQISIANDDPTNPYRYRPRCVTISEGTVVTFRAVPDFGMHPLYGGTVDGGAATMDPASPIGSIGIGTEAMRVLVTSGEFPFFCDVHYDQGMAGSIRVVPELFANGFDGPIGGR